LAALFRATENTLNQNVVFSNDSIFSCYKAMHIPAACQNMF